MILTEKLKEKINGYFNSLKEAEFEELLVQYGLSEKEEITDEDDFIVNSRKLEFSDIRIGLEFYRCDVVESGWVPDRITNFEKLTSFVNYINGVNVPMGKFRIKVAR